MFFHAIPLLLQELTDEFAIKIPEDRTVAKRCVAIEVLKRSRPKSRNGVNASFTGVVTSNVKHVQKMSNLQSVNNYERNEKKYSSLDISSSSTLFSTSLLKNVWSSQVSLNEQIIMSVQVQTFFFSKASKRCMKFLLLLLLPRF